MIIADKPFWVYVFLENILYFGRDAHTVKREKVAFKVELSASRTKGNQQYTDQIIGCKQYKQWNFSNGKGNLSRREVGCQGNH